MQGRISGMSYPFIEPYILREVLLYIDEILIFSYGLRQKEN